MQTRMLHSPVPERKPQRPARNTFRKLLDKMHTKVLEFRAPTRQSEPPKDRAFINLALSSHPNIIELQELMGKAKLTPGKITVEDIHSMKEIYLGILPDERDLLLDQQIYLALTTLQSYSTKKHLRDAALEVLDSVPEGGVPSFEPIISSPTQLLEKKAI